MLNFEPVGKARSTSSVSFLRANLLASWSGRPWCSWGTTWRQGVGMKYPEGQSCLNTHPCIMATEAALLRGGLQVLPLGSDGQCRSAECGWPTAARSGKPCHRTHRTGALALQSRRPWEGTPFLTCQPRPARDRTESKGKEEEDETKPEAERKGQVY